MGRGKSPSFREFLLLTISREPITLTGELLVCNNINYYYTGKKKLFQHGQQLLLIL